MTWMARCFAPPQSLPYLRFWYQVLTWVSVRLSEAARSMRSCTLRYFCRSKLRSSWLSWWSEKAVLALRGFLALTGGLSRLLVISRSPSSFVPMTETQAQLSKLAWNREGWSVLLAHISTFQIQLLVSEDYTMPPSSHTHLNFSQYGVRGPISV